MSQTYTNTVWTHSTRAQERCPKLTPILCGRTAPEHRNDVPNLHQYCADVQHPSTGTCRTEGQGRPRGEDGNTAAEIKLAADNSVKKADFHKC